MLGCCARINGHQNDYYYIYDGEEVLLKAIWIVGPVLEFIAYMYRVDCWNYWT